MNCQNGCKFLIERIRNGETEFFCRLIPAVRCMGTINCSAYEKKEQDEPDKKR